METPPKILFFTPTRIGDGVLATTLLAHIATKSSDARVTIMTSPFGAPLYAHYPLLERMIVTGKRPYKLHWLDNWKQVVGERWDQVWDLHGSAISYLLRVGERHIFFGGNESLPKVKQFEEMLHTGPLPYPVLWASPTQEEKAAELLPEGTKYLVLGPCANWPPKEWPMQHFIDLARMLLLKGGFCEGWRPVVVCAPHERERALRLLDTLAPFHPIDLTTGEHELLTIYACMKRASGYIGNDSGLMHMAAAAGIPTIGLFGPTPSVVYQPWGKHAKAVVAPETDLAALTPQVVAQEFAALF